MALAPAILSDAQTSGRQEIDANIGQLESQIFALKTRPNTGIPIARLHAEVLQHIFVLVSRGSKSVGKASLLTSWICHDWRDLAHQTTALWNYIDFLNPTWVADALSRTRNRPLVFDVYLKSKDSQDIQSFGSICLQNLPRIRTLCMNSVAGGPVTRFSTQSSDWANPVSLLVELKLLGISIPSNAFGGIFPTLKTLHLHGCVFDWGWLPVRQGLTNLSIHNPRHSTSAKHIMDIVHVLGSGLERLSLRSALPFVNTEHPIDSSGPSVTLDKLQHLDIHSESPGLPTYILNRISFPQHCDVDIAVGGGEEQLTVAQALVSCRGSGAWPVASLSIGLDEQEITISITTQPDGRLTLTSLSFQIWGAVQDMFICFDILPLPSIKVLSFFGGYLEYKGAQLIPYFDRKGAIDRLNVDDYFIPSFTSAIYAQNQRLRVLFGYSGDQRYPREELDEDRKVECRSILTFHQLTQLHYHGDGDDTSFRIEHYTILYEWLKWRTAAGLELNTLVFREMVIPSLHALTVLFEDIVDDLVFTKVKDHSEDQMQFSFYG